MTLSAFDGSTALIVALAVPASLKLGWRWTLPTPLPDVVTITQEGPLDLSKRTASPSGSLALRA